MYILPSLPVYLGHLVYILTISALVYIRLCCKFYLQVFWPTSRSMVSQSMLRPSALRPSRPKHWHVSEFTYFQGTFTSIATFLCVLKIYIETPQLIQFLLGIVRRQYFPTSQDKYCKFALNSFLNSMIVVNNPLVFRFSAKIFFLCYW